MRVECEPGERRGKNRERINLYCILLERVEVVEGIKQDRQGGGKRRVMQLYSS